MVEPPPQEMLNVTKSKEDDDPIPKANSLESSFIPWLQRLGLGPRGLGEADLHCLVAFGPKIRKMLHLGWMREHLQ